jgi:hypothetical protein
MFLHNLLGFLNLYFAKVTKFLRLQLNINSSDHSLQDYTHKTVHTVYTATKQETYTCYKYRVVQKERMFFK